MQNIFIGECIRQRRNELNLTQQQVCDGICDPVSLSRIENGKQTPRRSIPIGVSSATNQSAYIPAMDHEQIESLMESCIT